MDALRRSVEGAKGDAERGRRRSRRRRPRSRARQGQDAQRPDEPDARMASSTALRQYHQKRNFTRTKEPRGQLEAQDRRPVRRAEACGAPAALRFAPRARWRAEKLGRHQGAEPVARGQAPRGARRGPSARLRRVRGPHPARASTAPAASSSGIAAGGRPRATRTSSSPRDTSSSTSMGSKLKGRWHLVHMKGRDQRGKENWLLIKAEDEYATAQAAAPTCSRPSRARSRPAARSRMSPPAT